MQEFAPSDNPTHMITGRHNVKAEGTGEYFKASSSEQQLKAF